MSRITDNEAIQAAKVLKEYCVSWGYCEECVFLVYSPVGCAINDPYEWSIPDPVPAPPESQDSKRLREREEFFSGTYEERAQRKEDDAQSGTWRSGKRGEENDQERSSRAKAQPY